MGFPVDPEQPVTFPLLCDWVCTMAAVQPTGTSSFLGSGAVFQVGWKIITSSSCLESFLLLLFQGKAITAFLRGEWLLPLLLPDISYWLFFFFPACFPTKLPVQFSSVQSLSRVQLCDSMDFSTPGFPVHHQLKLMSIESVMPSNHLILCLPLLLLPSIFPSIKVFSKESVLHIRWPKYWSFSFSISPSNEYSGLISFRIDWLDLLPVQGTLKSLSQHHISKASILQHLAFFIVQLSHPYMTTGKTKALTRQTFVGKVMSLLFNLLFRLVIAFLPRSKRLNFMAAVTICSDFGAQTNKVSHCFHCYPIYLPWSDGT